MLRQQWQSNTCMMEDEEEDSMGMTMTQKILARHVGRKTVEAGDLLVSQVDLVLANDITGPPAIKEFNKIGRPVFDRHKIALVPDHFSPCKDIKSATLCKELREFARQHEITHYFEVGRMGIEHALLPDKGLVAPGEIVIGADSHTCTYGAVPSSVATEIEFVTTIRFLRVFFKCSAAK